MKIEKIVTIKKDDRLYPNVCEIDHRHSINRSATLYSVKFTWSFAPIYLCSACLVELLAEFLKVDLTE